MKKHPGLLQGIITVFVLFFNNPLYSQSSSHKLDSLSNAYNTASTDTARYRVMLSLCNEFELLGYYDRGLDTANAIIKYARQSKHNDFTARGYNSAALFQNRKTLYKEGLLSLDSALYYGKNAKNLKTVSTTYINYALILGNIGLIDSALSYNFKALAIDSTVDDNRRLCNTLNNIGYSYLMKADYPKANEYFFKSLKVAEASGNERVMGNCLINIGAVYFEMEKFDLAEEYLHKCYESRKKTNNRQGLAAVLLNFTELYKVQGKYALALEKGQESITYSEPIGYFPNMAEAYSSMSGCYLKLGKADSAVFYARKAVDISREKKIKNTLPGNLVSLGNALAEKKSFEEAKINFEEALAIAKEIGRKNEIKSIYEKLSLILEEQGSMKDALDYYKKYKISNDSLLSESNQKAVANLEVEYNTEKKEKEIIQLNFEAQQKEISLQRKQLDLTKSELENKNKQQMLEQSEAARKLGDLELAQAESRNKILALEKKEEFQKNKAEIEKKTFLNYLFAGGMVALLLILFFAIGFFRQRQKFAKQKAIESTRSSIASDLHDDMGATLSSINIFSRLANEKLNGDGSQIKNLLEKINSASQEMMNNMSDMVWAIKPGNDATENLSLKIKGFAREILSPKEINYRIESNENSEDKISMEARRNIFLIAKEAINNIAKYSEAKNVLIKIEKENGMLHLEITDDGTGFSIQQKERVRGGSGLNNMQQRAEQLGGEFSIETGIGSGTKIKSIFSLDKINY